MESENKAEIAIEQCAKAEHEKSILMDQVKTLNDSVEKLKKQLEKIHKDQVKNMKVSFIQKPCIKTAHFLCNVNMYGVMCQDISEEKVLSMA